MMTFKKYRRAWSCCSDGSCAQCVMAKQVFEDCEIRHALLVEACQSLERVIDGIHANTQCNTLGLTRKEQGEQITCALQRVGAALRSLS